MKDWVVKMQKDLEEGYGLKTEIDKDLTLSINGVAFDVNGRTLLSAILDNVASMNMTKMTMVRVAREIRDYNGFSDEEKELLIQSLDVLVNPPTDFDTVTLWMSIANILPRSIPEIEGFSYCWDENYIHRLEDALRGRKTQKLVKVIQALKSNGVL